MDTSSALDTSLPHNPTTGKNYRGTNVDALVDAQDAAGYPTPEWAGFGQWKKAGRVVAKGQTNTQIIFMVPKIDKKTKKPVIKNGKPVLIKRTLRVFNMAQTVELEEVAAA
jgi:antirestriction protein ArdC